MDAHDSTAGHYEETHEGLTWIPAQGGLSSRYVTPMDALRNELDAIASCELADILATWQDWTDEQRTRLADYLRAETGAHGLLSVTHMRENGQEPVHARVITRQAKRLLQEVTR